MVFVNPVTYAFFALDVPEVRVFQQHYNELTRMLYNTNLTPHVHLIQEGVIALTDQEELNAIPTSSGKAQYVLPKVAEV